MATCFVCGLSDSEADGKINNLGLKLLHNIKFVLNDILRNENGIKPTNEGFICKACEMVCRQLYVIECERKTMRNILRRIIHCTHHMNSQDGTWYRFNSNAFNHFQYNGKSFDCKKCYFRTSQIAHLPPHYAFHQLIERRATKKFRFESNPSADPGKFKSRGSQDDSLLAWMDNATKGFNNSLEKASEICEFNIDSHEGDCLYLEDTEMLRSDGKVKDANTKYNSYCVKDCDQLNKRTDFENDLEDDIQNNEQKTADGYDNAVASAANDFDPNKTIRKCCTTQYIYTRKCNCQHFSQHDDPQTFSRRYSTDIPLMRPYICSICDQAFFDKETCELHEGVCCMKTPLDINYKKYLNKSRQSKDRPLHSSQYAKADGSVDNDLHNFKTIQINEADLSDRSGDSDNDFDTTVVRNTTIRQNNARQKYSLDQ